MEAIMNVSSLDKKLQLIETRLAKIEAQLNIPSQSISEATENQPLLSKNAYISHSDNAQIKSITKSGNLLGIIAIICFILAGGFIIKLSIESGWLTPARQIGIAVLFGFSLIGLGLKLIRFDRAYASLLPAAGIIILYLSVFAAQRVYFLISFELAIAISCAISLLCMCLYLKIKHDVYPLTASIGAYLAPVVLGLNINSLFSLYYFVVCSLTFANLSIWLKSRTLTMISAYLAIAVTAFTGFSVYQNNLIVYLLALHFFIFSIGTYLYSRSHNQPLTEIESWCFFPVLLLFYGTEFYFLNLIQPNLAASLSLVFAGFLIILYLIAKKIFAKNMTSQSMIFTFAAIVIFHSGYLVLLPPSAGHWLFVVIMTGIAFLPVRIYENRNWSYLPFAILILTIIGIEYYKIAFDLFFFRDISWLIVLFAVLSIWLLFIRQNYFLEKDEEYGYAVLSPAHLLVILAFYRITTHYGSLAVSASWLAYATLVVIFAFIRKDKIMANSALLVLGFSAAKALLYDAASAPTIIRILCLLLTGIVFYAAGFLFRRIAEWRK